MELNTKQNEVLTEIFNLLNIQLIQELKITIPPHIYHPLPKDFKTVKSSHIEYLSSHYIQIIAFSSKLHRQIKIWFGPQRKLKLPNEIIIEFEYAPEIIFQIIKIIEPKKLQIITSNTLFERNSIYDKSFSTFDEFSSS
ncbi:hypothetical protein [Sulfurimonas microaerophilic]|uniref:hypothetical protein n=1 Tax=Sulfurimonas microaerophilic TaxID=3058392 RepID=UPI0027152922|nr:hypothetical protein [Sulfurimonas sp. hsl 1-7]